MTEIQNIIITPKVTLLNIMVVNQQILTVLFDQQTKEHQQALLTYSCCKWAVFEGIYRAWDTSKTLNVTKEFPWNIKELCVSDCSKPSTQGLGRFLPVETIQT